MTKELLEMACIRIPTSEKGQLLKWNYMYCALGKLTEGEARKVVSSVAEENGCGAWRQLDLRFEPGLEA